MKSLINQFIKNEDGVTAIEYAVIGVAMAAGLVAIMGGTGGTDKGFIGKLSTAFKNIGDKIATTSSI